jgi:hypothetical protein
MQRAGEGSEKRQRFGAYVTKFNVHTWLKFDIESLTKNSADVVVGVASSNASEVSPDGQLIVTDYRVNMTNVLKGKVNSGSDITVHLPGGRVEFEDGTSAEVITPNFERMENDKKYVLFLGKEQGDNNRYILTGGSQGLFEVTDKGISHVDVRAKRDERCPESSLALAFN